MPPRSERKQRTAEACERLRFNSGIGSVRELDQCCCGRTIGMVREIQQAFCAWRTDHHTERVHAGHYN